MPTSNEGPEGKGQAFCHRFEAQVQLINIIGHCLTADGTPVHLREPIDGSRPAAHALALYERPLPFPAKEKHKEKCLINTAKKRNPRRWPPLATRR